MGDVLTSYDELQYCSALKRSKNKTVSMDCPYTGKGDEFSPGDLVEAALAGCVLLSMGAMAMRHEIDLTGTQIDVTITSTDKPVMRFQSIDAQVAMPEGLKDSQKRMLERAAEGCPIKHSFGSDIPVSVSFNYPD